LPRDFGGKNRTENNRLNKRHKQRLNHRQTLIQYAITAANQAAPDDALALLQATPGTAGTPADCPDASSALGRVTIPDNSAKDAADCSTRHGAYSSLPAYLHLIGIVLTIN
jgi:hypothetical protein